MRRNPNLKCFRFSPIATGAMAQTHQPKDLHQGQKTHLICQEALSDFFLFLVYPWLRSAPLLSPPPSKKKAATGDQANVVSCWMNAKGCIGDLLCILSAKMGGVIDCPAVKV